MAILTDTLLEGIKRHAVVPNNQALYSDADLLAFVDDNIRGHVVPLIKSANQDYFVTTYSQALTADVGTYDIPTRAIGRALRDLKLIDASNNTIDMPKIAIEDEHYFNTNFSGTKGFYFKGDKIVVIPTPTVSTSTLQIWYEIMPSNAVVASDAAQVSGISGNIVTVTSVPSTMSAGVVVDFVQAESGGSILAMDKSITNVSGTQITFTSGDVPTDLIVGDYIALKGESPILNGIPDEATKLIEHLVLTDVLAGIGDFDAMRRQDDEIKELKKNLLIIVEPRITGEQTKIINRRGLLRGQQRYYRRSLYF